MLNTQNYNIYKLVLTSFCSAYLAEFWGSFRLRRPEKRACVLQPAGEGHLADVVVRSIAAHLPLVVRQYLGHDDTGILTV